MVVRKHGAGAIARVRVRNPSEAVSENVDVPLAPMPGCSTYPAPPEVVPLPVPLLSMVIPVWPARPGTSTVISSSSKAPRRRMRASAIV